jgi:hypothetical protein
MKSDNCSATFCIRTIGILLLSVGPQARAQVAGITINHSAHISTDAPSSPHFECFIAVNPRNPNNIVATTYSIRHGHYDSPVYVSFDAGRTWQVSKVTGREDHMGDPTAYFGPDGTAYYLTMNTPGNVIYRSTDGGKNFSPYSVAVRGLDDRPYLTIDTTRGPHAGNIYITGMAHVFRTDGGETVTAAMVRSVDSGRVFERIRFLEPGEGWPSSSRFESPPAGEPVVTPDGTLAVPVLSASPTVLGDSIGRGHISLWVSKDGGMRFLPVTPGTARTKFWGPTMWRGIHGVRSAVDMTRGPHRGTIYVTWSNYENGHNVIRLARTKDLGKTWATTLVNDAPGADASTPSVAVNKDGVVGVSFYDRRDDPNNECYRLYFAASVDGGATFSPNLRVGNDLSCPTAAKNWSPTIGGTGAGGDLRIDLGALPTHRAQNAGETAGLQADANGRFQLVFINGFAGSMQLWSASVDVDAAAISRSIAARKDPNDVTSDVDLDISEPVVDFASHTITVRARVTNRRDTALRGPLSLTVLKAKSVFANVRAANATTGNADRSTWRVPLQSDMLPAKGKSGEMVLQWSFTGDPPVRVGRSENVLLAEVRVYRSTR